jgi:hypothetical protein
MRTQPTAVDFAANMRLFDGSAASTITNIVISSSGNQNIPTVAASSTGLTQFRPYRIISEDAQFGFIGFSAEL